MKNLSLYLFVLVSCSSVSDSSDLFDKNSAAPEIVGFGTISSTEFHESINYIDEDNIAIYFTRSDRQFDSSVIYVSYYEKGEWQVGSKLPFSTSDYDAGFSFAPNRNLAFFTSKRTPNLPGLSAEWNIWKVSCDKVGNWSEPKVLDARLNSEGHECCLTMNGKGQTFFSSDRDGSWDIYEARFVDDGFVDVRKIEGFVNSEYDEWPGFINEDGNMLFFSSIRKSGLGGDDIYFSKKSGELWGDPVLLNLQINSNSYEDSPILTGDNRFLLFSSWRENNTSKGLSNIYFVPFDEKEHHRKSY